MSETPLPAGNVPEFTVTSLAGSLKRTIEESFGRVRVRGELSKVKVHTSGHLYTTLKDDGAVIDAVCWRGTLARLSVRPEEGMEVICTGRVTTYPARSNYQLVIESMELAGQGALLKLLEDRKKKLAGEGLFAPERKQDLPALPRVIGVVTSPTGAVIRDILHRLRDRFPCHVIVWPVPVQGAGAAEKIAAAIAGFDALPQDFPRPDVLIVARGGGSLEDLMAFNEESVVRAAAACRIPLISAVGHETDTTLIDFVSDRRAPTPTAAAEMAVPVRLALVALLQDDGQRLVAAAARGLADRRQRLESLCARMGEPERMFEARIQRLDHLDHRLGAAFEKNLGRVRTRLAELGGRILHPRRRILEARTGLDFRIQALHRAAGKNISDRGHRLGGLAGRLTPPRARIAQARQMLTVRAESLSSAGVRVIRDRHARLDLPGRLLETLSFQAVLTRGFALVRDEAGHVISSASAPAAPVRIRFHDGERDGKLL
ncbi:MAG: exodeoxyribonuclease VII large subunit [Rhodospirillales bacterium]|nr:exodeoxyribonuclease VII large subunit [Rhodospirillales bacterium]